MAKGSAAASSRTAHIRALARIDSDAAVAGLTAFLHDVFDIDVIGLRINRDQYSLNSLNGFFHSDGAEFFFKFHQEDGEEDMKGEYYRAEIIADAGLPIDMPVLMSTFQASRHWFTKSVTINGSRTSCWPWTRCPTTTPNGKPPLPRRS